MIPDDWTSFGQKRALEVAAEFGRLAYSSWPDAPVDSLALLYGPMTHAELRRYLLANYPESRLELLTEEKESTLVARHPELPPDYTQFLRKVGWGAIGDGRYSVYSAPVEPSFVFDPVTAESLDNVVLIGDDFAGGLEAFRFQSKGVVFGSVDSLDGRFEPASETFSEFIQRWFVTT